MTHVAEHHSKKEWVRHNSQQSRVGLAVVRYTIGVHNVLEPVANFSRLDVGWLRDPVSWVDGDPDCRELASNFLDSSLFVHWSPEESGECLILPFHHVQRLI